jgi:hypothetical protein
MVPETPPLHVQTWPWPVRIHTLGQFQVDREDTISPNGRNSDDTDDGTCRNQF